MDFGNILSTTWKTIWKHKVILWFGLLVVTLPVLLSIFIGGAFAFFTPENIGTFFETSFDNGLLILFMAVAYLTIMALAFALYALSLAGVTKGTLELKDKEDTLSFGKLWDASFPYLGRVIGVLLTVGFAFFLVFSLPLIFGALVGALTAGLGFLCMMPLMLLIMPLGLVAYLLLSLSTASVVVDDLGIFDAIQRAWGLMRQKFWSLVLMAVILYFIQMAVGMIIMVPMQVMQFAFMIPMSSGEIDPDTFFRFYGIAMTFFIPISAAVQSLGMTYVNAAWALTILDISSSTPDEAEIDDDVIEYV